MSGPTAWLRRMFEYKYCAECGGDARHHRRITGPFGHPRACCAYPPVTGHDGEPWMHPVVLRYRRKQGTAPADGRL